MGSEIRGFENSFKSARGGVPSSCIIFDPVSIRGSVVLASEADTFFAVQSDIKCVVNDKFYWIIIIFYFLYQFSGGIKNTSMNFYGEIL